MRKYLKISYHELAALLIILSSVVIRLLLIAQRWPLTNSDEDTMGIMALHIAYRGEHPIFFYGQNYMGTLEAYIGAILFHIFGPSLFTLRLGLLLMITLFLFSTYLLTRMLYTKGFALVTVALLGAGSSYVIGRELSAIGGYPETLLFGSLSFLFASLLAFSYRTDRPLSKRWQRWILYLCWGGVIGLGLWSDLLIAPFAVMSGLLILLYCWQDLLRVVPALCLLAGLCIGAFPLIRYNLHAAPGEDSLTVLWKLQHGGNALHYTSTVLSKELLGTIQVSIPMMTGNPFCPVDELSLQGPTSPHTLTCTLIHSTWGFGYLILFLCALLLTLWAGWQVYKRWRIQREEQDIQRDLVRTSAQLLLLGSAILTLLLYTFSAAPIDWPGIHARYIIGVLVATPAVIWPLWYDGLHLQGWLRFNRIIRLAMLLCIGIGVIIGTGIAFSETPTAQADYQQEQRLENHLVSMGATHIYTDYWTCDKIAFLSQERIICGVLDAQLQPSHNRYMPYYELVSHDPHTAYVFHQNDYDTLLKARVELQPNRYQVTAFDGYMIVQPQ